jgi:hypothetical protein
MFTYFGRSDTTRHIMYDTNCEWETFDVYLASGA